MSRSRFAAIAALLFALCLAKPQVVMALDPQNPEAPDDCLGPSDPFCTTSGGSSGGGGGATCTATSICRNASGQETGSISCSGTTCSRGLGWVKCNGTTYYCGVG